MHELLVYYMADVIDTVYLVGIHRSNRHKFAIESDQSSIGHGT